MPQTKIVWGGLKVKKTGCLHQSLKLIKHISIENTNKNG